MKETNGDRTSSQKYQIVVHKSDQFRQTLDVMEHFDTNIFLSFYLFFLILYFFSFEFLFPFSDEEEACDIAVT